MGFVHLGVLEERHECTENSTEDIESTHTCTEPLLVAIWYVAVSEVGGSSECAEHNDRDAHVMVLSLVFPLAVVVQPTVAQTDLAPLR